MRNKDIRLVACANGTAETDGALFNGLGCDEQHRHSDNNISAGRATGDDQQQQSDRHEGETRRGEARRDERRGKR
jgi:hypothetical protein